MTLNIDGFRSKREDFVNMIERFEARSGRKLSVIGLCETKLGDAEAPDVPGFRVVARRDRAANDGGGGVAVLVRDSYAARAIDGPPDDASETLAVALGDRNSTGRRAFTGDVDSPQQSKLLPRMDPPEPVVVSCGIPRGCVFRDSPSSSGARGDEDH